MEGTPVQITAKGIFDGKNFSAGGCVHITGTTIAKVEGGGKGADLLMPGLIDSHVHLLGTGLALQALDLNQCRSKADFARTLQEYAQTYQGQWLTGRGWDQNKLGFTPDRYFLDAICPQRPVVLTRICGHVVVANSRALELAGIDRNRGHVPGGVVRRDDSGQPTGILEEKAAFLIVKAVPDPEPALLYTALEKAIKYAHSCGLTGVQTDDRGTVAEYHQLWELYCQVTQSHPLRCQLHYQIDSVAALQEYIRTRRDLRATKFICPGAAKLLLDGSLGARTAALRDDYYDDPGNKGVLIYPDSVVRDILTVAEANGVQIALHAIGDAAIEQALRVLAAVRGGYGQGAIRQRLVHCQVTNPDQIKRMVALGIAAEIQPGFLQTDRHWAGARLGGKRLQNSYCWRTMAAAGLFLSGGSDAPVEDLNPWQGIGTGVRRTDSAGNPIRGWDRDERLDLEKALEIYTSGAAELAGWNRLGRVQAGMLADLAVYNYFDEKNPAQNKPSQVIIDGTIVYEE